MTPPSRNRRQFLRELGVSVSTLPFMTGLTLGREATDLAAPKRLILVFSPNGTLPEEFWPEQFGFDCDLHLKPMLSPLEPFREHTLMLKGINNKIEGDGDRHMRGMSCLLTGRRLNPGNIQGGSDSPAGWASGISIDQQLAQYFQSREESRTRFGSLEFGVAVPNRADPWTRMCYAGDDQPIAPIDHPARMFEKLYGGVQGQQDFESILAPLQADLKHIAAKLDSDDRQQLERHIEHVRQFELDIQAAEKQSSLHHPEPEIDPDIELVNDNTPMISRTQIDLLVNALANDMTRVASLQYMRSVGQARMRWLDIEEGHHGLSHEPDDNQSAYDKLKRINTWFAGEVAYLAAQLANTAEPSGIGGTLLDHTQIVWLNELGKGNNHTLDNLPIVLIGGGAGFRTGHALDLKDVAHNRLLLTLAQGLGYQDLATFGAEEFCEGGALQLN